ncbi:MAG: secretion protein HlyD [candidate division Zixibacteria bacterium RBG_19FT_COMBO_42_43]|nr:MAG: secretion protein HlyD [candidate division Zixibacteria bacterium RBG_19FT_COMBO_42_43]
MTIVFMGGVLVVLGLLTSCSHKNSHWVPGYVEGEFVYVASPLAGRLDSLYVERGQQVKAGDPFFALENTSEKSARDEAERRLAQAKANLEDVKKGKRPSEMESIEAQLKQAQAVLVLSEKELTRQEELFRSSLIAEQDLERGRSRRDQDHNRVVQLEADLKTAQLGSRIDQIQAAENEVGILKAALVQAEWNLSQKRQTAPETGLVFDVLYRQGEWVAAGRPVVALLPPQNIKVRAFVPETQVGRIHPGDSLRIAVDGSPKLLIGKVSFISPQAEYTPPVIYSKNSRDKLVFMIEVVFDPKTSAGLHPGQPVDVQLKF